jgi:cytochrome c-type biogenesis protein CcmH/NrfG
VNWADAAVWSAVFAGLSAFAAFRAVRQTQRAAEAEVLLSLMNDYAASDMADALRRLRRWLETHPNDVGEHWKLGSDPEALLVDTARRRVSSYFQNAERLYKAGLITRCGRRPRWGRCDRPHRDTSREATESTGRSQ